MRLFKLNTSSMLALRALAVLRNETRLMTNEEISDEMGASKDHLSKVLQRLARFDIVKPVRGPHGGYMLTRPLSGISVLDVIEAQEGRSEAWNPKTSWSRPERIMAELNHNLQDKITCMTVAGLL